MTGRPDGSRWRRRCRPSPCSASGRRPCALPGPCRRVRASSARCGLSCQARRSARLQGRRWCRRPRPRSGFQMKARPDSASYLSRKGHCSGCVRVPKSAAKYKGRRLELPDQKLFRRGVKATARCLGLDGSVYAAARDCSTSAAKAAGSFTARSASILRSISMPDLISPPIICE